MSLDLGSLLRTAIFGALFIVMVTVQISTQKFNAWLYWTTIIATTTVGTTLADFADRSLGIGYSGGSSMLLFLLLASLFVWHRVLGSVAVATIRSPKAEAFYWLTIMFSQTQGTALGDWSADTAGLGYAGGAVLFSTLLLIVAGGYFLTRISRTALFWAAFILTRPLGAVVGDFLDKPADHGDLALDRFSASAVLLLFIVAVMVIFPQKAARQAH